LASCVAKEKTDSNPSRGNHARILVIDDNEAIRHVLATFLPGFGYVVTVADSGEAGLEAAQGR